MKHDQPVPTFNLADFVRRIVIAGIKNARKDPSEMKQRIMLARQCGFLDDEETEWWIAANGLVVA